MSSSSDEGEIREEGEVESKAITMPQSARTGVDRSDRGFDRRSRSPQYRETSRRDRSPRGSKRGRDDARDYNRNGGRGEPDPRHFRIHYEDQPSRRNRYEDLDNPSGQNRYYDRDFSASMSHDDDRDRPTHPSKRPRSRSPSSYSSRSNGMREPAERRDRAYGRSGQFQSGAKADLNKYSPPRDPVNRNGYGSSRETVAARASDSKRYAKTDQGATADRISSDVKSLHVSESRNDSNAKVAEPVDQVEQPVDEEAEIERRRQRRAELLRKARNATPLHVQAVESAAASPKAGSLMDTPKSPREDVGTPRSPGIESLSPAVLGIDDDADLGNKRGGLQGDDDGPSAADYDPTLDMQEDERRDELRSGNVELHGQVLAEASGTTILAPSQAPSAAEDEADKDDDDDFDMFAEDFDEEKLKIPDPVANLTVQAAANATQPNAQAKGTALLDDDDKDGYYKIRSGDVLDGRYQIQSGLGKGMFSGVARALDSIDKEVVAIKLMRNNDALKKGGFTEIAILEKLNSADPDDKKHIVSFKRSFEHKGHLCMVFENLSLNLREVLRKFGNNVGINLGATRAYAYQMFLALAHMRKCSIIHADIKPDNILVNEARNVLKICDLGTAIDRSDAATANNEITPYLVSRFYRAPEVMLGAPYDTAVDVWSIGCTLYELYTGKILFTGDSNNQMLRSIMEIRGKISAKVYRRGELHQLHFDDLGNFVSQERDKVLGKSTVRVLARPDPGRDLRTRLAAAAGRVNDEEARQLGLFHDLLDRCLAVNPDKRITPAEALKHAFFAQKLGSVPARK